MAPKKEQPKVIQTPGAEDGDDFEDIVDSPYGDVHAALMTGDGDEAEFAIEAGGSAEDLAFDKIVEVLQEIVLSDEFQAMLRNFGEKHCHEFEDSEENKLVYTELFKKYSDSIEEYVFGKLAEALPGFDVASFLEELEARGDSEIDEGVLDLLNSLSDFCVFKQQMLAHKNKEKISLTIQGKTAKIYEDEDEEGDLRPDLEDLMKIVPPSPSKQR
mmetsp:Transcript_36042/g.84521  ORF Transcript_36042/g.84521 Transcript_36042/m.84521 type:complete len:215 (-) Transcript_36042:45-689(-)